MAFTFRSQSTPTWPRPCGPSTRRCRNAAVEAQRLDVAQRMVGTDAVGDAEQMKQRELVVGLPTHDCSPEIRSLACSPSSGTKPGPVKAPTPRSPTIVHSFISPEDCDSLTGGHIALFLGGLALICALLPFGRIPVIILGGLGAAAGLLGFWLGERRFSWSLSTVGPLVSLAALFVSGLVP